jgi:predicted RNA binding protein YcfA (HicA-like mRNA interferase family)
MKRVDLIRHLEACGCAFLREGGRHTVYVNRTARKVSTIPRHREINDFMAKKICRELEIAIRLKAGQHLSRHPIR